MTNIMKMVKQAQEMQAKMARIQDELAREEFEAASGGGAVRARVNGKHELLKLTIRDDVLRDGDKEMLEELVAAAVNEAYRMASNAAKERIAAVAGGVHIPGLF
jgi:hypothetical protein